MRATCCLTCCAGLLFAGAWCTVQSGRIARSAPEFAGTQLDKLYGIRCPRPPTLALPERSCSRTDCSCPLLTQALDRQTPRRPAPRPQSSLASAIPTDAAETAAATPHRVALHGIQASVAWAVTYVLVHRAAWLKVGMEARTRRCGTLSILSLSLILQRVRVCHAVIWLCVPSDACAVCARATRAISSFRSRHHLGLAGRLRMHVLIGEVSVCCE